MSDIFQNSIPEPFRIFGIRLLPFSIGRYRLLRRFNCGFVCEEEREVSLKSIWSDLVLGIVICSMRVNDFLWLLEKPKRFTRELSKWGKVIRRRIRKEKHFNLLEKVGLFRAYLDQAAKIPKYWDEHGGESVSGSHWSHSVEVLLRGELGYTQEEIQEGPMSKALADHFKWAEGQGLIRIMTNEEANQGNDNERILKEIFDKLPPKQKLEILEAQVGA